MLDLLWFDSLLRLVSAIFCCIKLTSVLRQRQYESVNYSVWGICKNWRQHKFLVFLSSLIIIQKIKVKFKNLKINWQRRFPKMLEVLDLRSFWGVDIRNWNKRAGDYPKRSYSEIYVASFFLFFVLFFLRICFFAFLLALMFITHHPLNCKWLTHFY